MIGAIVTAAFAGLVALLNAFFKNRREDRAQRGDEAGIIIERQERQIARLERVLDEHQAVVNGVQESLADCREEHAEWRTYGTILRERVQNCLTRCEMGAKFGPLPPTPVARPRRLSPEDVAFQARTMRQSLELAHGVDERLQNPRPPRPSGVARRPAEPPQDLGGTGT